MMVSIIVPVYNTSKYLRQCVESVLSQSYQDWELLLLNDGSSDNSGDICDNYSLRDSRIKVIHKANSGVSDTRNLGIDISNGEFLIFLDSDDYWIDNQILSIFVENAQKYKLDIVRANYCEINNYGEIIHLGDTYDSLFPHSEVMTYLQYMRKYVCRNYLACVFMIRKKTLGALRFNTERFFMEDAELYMRLFQKDLRCMYINKCFYAYRKHATSVTVRYNPKKYKDAFNFSRLCYDLSEETDDSMIQSFLINEGAKNFVRYLQIISLDNNIDKNLCELFRNLEVFELKRTTMRRIKYLDQMSTKLVCSIPLIMIRGYFRFEYAIKAVLRPLFNRCRPFI